VERELWVGGAEAGDEVIFEGSNGAFCGVAAMDVGGGELEVDILAGHELLEGTGRFVV
jgi:hypothetical protein